MHAQLRFTEVLKKYVSIKKQVMKKFVKIK